MNTEEMKGILAERNRYQTHTWDGVILNKGIRGIERRALLRVEDIAGRRVVDLGCATGAESLAALEAGAIRVCGVERDAGIARDAERLVYASGSGARVEIVNHDLKTGLPEQVTSQTWDTVFAFAILQHSGQQRFWETVPGATVAYVESGAPCSWNEDSLSRNGWHAESLGMTPNNSADTRLLRGLFRLEKR